MKKNVLFFIGIIFVLFSSSASPRSYSPIWIGNEYVFKWTGNELLLMHFVDLTASQETIDFDGSFMPKDMPVLPEVTVFSARAWDVDEEYYIEEYVDGQQRPEPFTSCRPGLYEEVNQILSVNYFPVYDETAIEYLTYDVSIERGKMTLVIKKITYRNGKEESEKKILSRVYLTR